MLRKSRENNNKKAKNKSLIYKDKFMVKNADYAFNINGLQLP